MRLSYPDIRISLLAIDVAVVLWLPWFGYAGCLPDVTASEKARRIVLDPAARPAGGCRW